MGVLRPDLAVIAEVLADLADTPRWLTWRTETRSGRPTKVPMIAGHGPLCCASSTDARTWRDLRTAQAALANGHQLDGPGIVLGQLEDGRWLVGVDLDLCRSPSNGQVEAWAERIVARLGTYAEVSPSGTGIKAIGYADRLPPALLDDTSPKGLEVTARDVPIPPGAEGSGHSKPEIGLYPSGRFFTLTGHHLDTTPLEPTDITQPLAELAHELAGWSRSSPRPTTPLPLATAVATGELPPRVAAAIENVTEIGACWRDGTKIGTGGDASRSGVEFSLALTLAGRVGCSDEEIATALLAFPHGQIPTLKGSARQRRITRVLTDVRRILAAEQHAQRPVISFREDRPNDAVRAAVPLLQGKVFCRGPIPVLVSRAAEAAPVTAGGVTIGGIRHEPDAAIFLEATPDRVAFHLDDAATFTRWDARRQAEVAKSCPPLVATRLVAVATELGFWPVLGIAHVPILMPNGTILATAGYDRSTGLFLDLPGRLVDVPERPSREDAQAALTRLLQPFRGFDGAAPREAMAAAALTAILRPSLPTAPAILIDANQPGAGKGKLARALAVLCTGRGPSVIGEGSNAEELEKRIASAILSGSAAFVLDNLQRPLESSALESVLTEATASIRLFGRLVEQRVTFSALTLITSNNARLRTDMLRRSLPVRIVVEDDKPELRSFDFDPVAEVARDRAELIAAGLTIARAWLLTRKAGEQGGKVLGSFEHWAEIVGGAVAWLTGCDPVDLIEAAKDESPSKARDRAVMEALAECFGDQEFRVAQIMTGEVMSVRTLLAEALDCEAHELRGVLGKWLRSNRDAVHGGLILRGRSGKAGLTAWRVKRR